jgi:sarcosine dehydrogenase
LVGLEAIVRNGEYVGHVRRGDHAYFIDKEMAYGYVSNPQGEKITQTWLAEGDYQIEARGQLYDARLHLKTPFDSANDRIQGHYNSDDGLVQTQEQKLLDYKSMINTVSVRYHHTSNYS